MQRVNPSLKSQFLILSQNFPMRLYPFSEHLMQESSSKFLTSQLSNMWFLILQVPVDSSSQYAC